MVKITEVIALVTSQYLVGMAMHSSNHKDLTFLLTTNSSEKKLSIYLNQ